VTIHADLVTGVLMQNGETTSISVTRDCSYRVMWSAVLATLGGTPNPDLCPLDEGLAVVDAIAACRESVDRNAWVRV